MGKLALEAAITEFFKIQHLPRSFKAPEGWRSPKPGGKLFDPGLARASWTAPALWPFSLTFSVSKQQ